MKFGEFLEKEKITEWSDFYINYKKLCLILEPMKKLYKTRQILENKEKLSINSLLISSNSSQQYLKIADSFINTLIIEINKLLYFYTENIIFYINRIEKINDQLKYLKDNYSLLFESSNFLKAGYNTYDINYDNLKGTPYYNCTETLELVLKELYKEVNLIKHYMEINIKAEDKIIKKFKKYSSICLKHSTIHDLIKIKFLKHSLKVMKSDSTQSRLISEIETVFSCYFGQKYSLNSTKILKEYIEKKHLNYFQFYYFGIFTGILITILFVIYLICYNYDIDMDDDREFKQIFPIFRSIIVISFYLWILCINTYFWNNNKINYKKVFKFNNHYSPLSAQMKRAALLTTIVFLMILMYLIIRCNISSRILFFIYILPLNFTPLICWVCLIVYLLLPFRNYFNYEGRCYLFKVLKEGGIFLKTDFEHIWVYDQLTSLSGFFRDIIYACCYYTTYIYIYYTFNPESNSILENNASLNNDLNDVNNKKYTYEINHIRSKCHISFLFIFLSMLPYYIRALQCIKICILNKSFMPQGLNTIKYILSILSSFISYLFSQNQSYLKTWLFWATISSVYSFMWDIKMDWGFLEKKIVNNKNNRDKYHNTIKDFNMFNNDNNNIQMKLLNSKDKSILVSSNIANETCNQLNIEVNNKEYNEFKNNTLETDKYKYLTAENDFLFNKKDNNLLNINILRSRLSFKNKTIYYVCIVGDFIFRSFFLLSISPEIIKLFIRPEFFTLLIYLAEIIRRGLWNFIRVENRHLDICKDFRSTVYIETPLYKDLNGYYKIKDKSMKIELDEVNRRLDLIRKTSVKTNYKKILSTQEFLNKFERPELYINFKDSHYNHYRYNKKMQNINSNCNLKNINSNFIKTNTYTANKNLTRNSSNNNFDTTYIKYKNKHKNTFNDNCIIKEERVNSLNLRNSNTDFYITLNNEDKKNEKVDLFDKKEIYKKY